MAQFFRVIVVHGLLVFLLLLFRITLFRILHKDIGYMYIKMAGYCSFVQKRVTIFCTAKQGYRSSPHHYKTLYNHH